MEANDHNADSQRLIVFHAIDGIGLGHLSRLSAIALSVRDRSPETSMLFLVDGASHGILEAANLPFLSLPAHDLEKWTGRPLTDRIRRLTSSFAASIVEALHPNLIVFDCFPHRALTIAARQHRIPFAICIRKMRNMASLSEQFSDLLAAAALIIFPHTPGEIEVQVPRTLLHKVQFVGTIARPFPKPDTSSPSREVSVVISGGGGGYPGTVGFYNIALAAFTICRSEIRDLSGLLVTGPLFEDWIQLEPVQGVRIIQFDPNLISLVRNAQLVICQAGYNTIAEMMALDVPTICIPADRLADDQYERAAEAAAQGAGRIRACIDPDPCSLAEMMLGVLRSPQSAPSIRNFPPGAALAAQHLLALVDRGGRATAYRSPKLDLV